MEERPEAMAPAQLESLAAWGPGEVAGRLQVSCSSPHCILHRNAPLLHAEGLQSHCLGFRSKPAGKGHICHPHQPHQRNTMARFGRAGLFLPDKKSRVRLQS